MRSHQLNIADDADVDIADVARFLGTYTIGDNIPEGIPGEFRVGKARRRELVFAGAFPTSYLERLSSEDIAEFGDSRWRAGRLMIDRSKASG